MSSNAVSQAYRIVMEAMAQTNQDKAVRMCKEAINIDPDSKMAYYHLGMIYAGRGLYKLAIERYSEIVHRIDPEDPGIWFLLSRQLHMDRQLDKAIEHYKKTFELDPLCDKACLYISEILCDKGVNFAQAVQYANKSLELRTPSCMVDEDVFLANQKRAELLLKREKSKTGKNENGVDVIALRSNLSKASVLKLAEINPDIIPILMRHGIRCIGCAGYEDETIEQAAEANNSDLTKLLKELETAI